MKTIEVCVGIGLNQFFPEYVTIEIPQDSIENTSDSEFDSSEFDIELPNL